jgi:hypothetical protein
MLGMVSQDDGIGLMSVFSGHLMSLIIKQDSLKFFTPKLRLFFKLLPFEKNGV